MRVALFVDGANIFYAQRKLKWYIDFKKLYNCFTENHEIYNAYYYVGVRGPQGTVKDSFLRALVHCGYTVRTKSIKRILDDKTGEFDEKCNLDIEIAIDMINTAENYDMAILCSGDGDFERLIELLRSKGKEIIVVFTQGMVAWDLINTADRFVDLKQLRSKIEKE